MTDTAVKFPEALKEALQAGRLGAVPQSKGAFRPTSFQSETDEPSQNQGEREQPGVKPQRKRGRPSGSNPQSQTSIFGHSWRLGETLIAQTDEEKEEVAAMSNRELIFQRSEKRGDKQWNTVSVFKDGIDVIKRTVKQNEQGENIGWVEHKKLDSTIWSRPVYPIATVLIHTKNAPADPEKEQTSNRKIRWKGRDYNASDWSEAVISTSFDSQEVKAQGAASWFPIAESNWHSGLLPYFRIMILNDPETLMRNPSDPVGTKAEDLPQLPVEHRWNATGWCSATKYAGLTGQIPVWEHITPGHELYSGTQKSYVEVAGDEALYFDAMRDMITRRPMLAVWCGMFAGAYAHGLHDDTGKEFKGDTSTLINIFGEPGCGKTTTAQAMVAMVGQPLKDGLIVSQATDAGLELMADLTNHGSFVIDEMQKHLAKKAGTESLQHLMGLLNGTGKLASANAGQEIRDRRSFDNLIFGTANSKILTIIGRNMVAGDGHFAEALEQRVIELDAKEWSPFPSFAATDPKHKETQADIKDFTATLSATHGHLYAPIINYYKSSRHDIVNRLRALEREFAGRLTSKAIVRQTHFFAYTQVGIEALVSTLGLSDEVKENIQAQWELMINGMSREADQRDENKQDDIIDRIASWAEAHSRNFGVRTSNAKKFKNAYAWPTGKSSTNDQGQIEAASWRSQQAEQSGLYGWWVQDTPMTEEGAWSGELWITAAGRDAMEKDRVSSLPLSDLLQSALKRGWVDATYDSAGNFSRLDKKLSNGSYAYKLLLGKAKAELEAGADPLLIPVPSDTNFDPKNIFSSGETVGKDEAPDVFKNDEIVF